MKIGESPNTRAQRKDAGIRTTLRLDADTYSEVDVLQFKHKCSFNGLYFAMIRYCLESEDFRYRYLEEKYPRNRNGGFFSYHPFEDDPTGEHGFRR